MNPLPRMLTATTSVLLAVAIQLFPVAPSQGQATGGNSPAGALPATRPRHDRSAQLVDPKPRTLSPYFTRAGTAPKRVDPDGFIQRWLLLEPIAKPNRTNTVFTGAYVRAAFEQPYFPNQFTVVPKDGEVVKVGEQELRWHALDSAQFNVKLFRFAYGLDKPVYGVVFWAVTVVDSPREMKNVRLAAGSNSASMWWVNGQQAVSLFDDRRMVMDDAVSGRLTLARGRNVIRGAVINGPGMSDFCARFVDENGDPIVDLAVALELP